MQTETHSVYVDRSKRYISRTIACRTFIKSATESNDGSSRPVNICRRPQTRFFRIYTTFILGTALLNFGPRANNMGHGLLDFCRVKANFSARVPKNLGGPRPPQEVVSAPWIEVRVPKVEEFSFPESLPSWLTMKVKALGSKILYFSREERHGVEFASGATLPHVQTC